MIALPGCGGALLRARQRRVVLALALLWRRLFLHRGAPPNALGSLRLVRRGQRSAECTAPLARGTGPRSSACRTRRRT